MLRLVPSERRKQDAELRTAIDALLADPDLPCEVEGYVIPDGHGKHVG